MDTGLLIILIPTFFVIYSGVGMLVDAKKPPKPHWQKSAEPTAPSGLRELTQKLAGLGFNKAILGNSKFRENLELILIRGGYPFGWKAEDLLFYKELGILLACFFLFRSGTHNVVIWVGGLYMGFWLPEFWMKTKATARQAAIQRQLPGCIDLLTLTLEGGLDLMAAIEKITTKMKPNPLKEELQTVIQENRLGTPRKEALQHLAFRTDSQEVQSFTSMIIQSEELGTSLSVVLRTYAEDMRNRRILMAEEVAGKAPVKLLLPMMLFFFPVVFVIILGPLALHLFNSYK